MKIVERYSHLNGLEFLLVHKLGLWEEIQSVDQKKEIERAGCSPIYSYNQTDFIKDRVAIEIQFGKYAFIAYDLFRQTPRLLHGR